MESLSGLATTSTLWVPIHLSWPPRMYQTDEQRIGRESLYVLLCLKSKYMVFLHLSSGWGQNECGRTRQKGGGAREEGRDRGWEREYKHKLIFSLKQ